ncbi:MAG: T9SS type A sorting domain-containing protein [Lewinellaceae bacterium]|nr:T9SS type A sorting domain-containing protein [Lewinellaceae bacterium]
MLRSITLILAVTLGCFFFVSPLLAQDAILWTPSSEANMPRNLGERRIIPNSYKTFRLDIPALEAAIQHVPNRFSESAAESNIELTIPLPNGEVSRFRILEAPVMHPDLAAQFPQIRTFTGTGIDAPGATARLDWTPQGFHAMIRFPGNGTVFVDPYAFPDREYYLSYYKADFQKKDAEPFKCSFDEFNETDDSPKPGQDEPELNGDCKLRTYRLALACTGEYAAYHGGTVASALAAMATSMNRVNGVYETESGITMEMVPNNNLLVYLNPNTDPYTNGNGSAMLTQNINTCNSVIGSANYDIGHVFSTGGGGVAYLACVCGSSKAGGVTGSSNPVGDPFDIDYVAHEMGHQFGGRHTQNNSCNRDNNSCYEPGSASTIMGYAGICAPNVQNNSDDYFHVNSLILISTFVTGTGNNCAQSTTFNNQPTAEAGPSYVIPKGTPFVLTGTGSDPDGDPLTYCWEQYDKEIATMPPSANSTSGPAFRSFDPTPSNKRYFPNLDAIINNTNPTWEVLSNVGRTYSFRLTVRDNHPNGGCAYQDNMVVTVAGGSGPFQVTSPNTFVSWPAFSQQTVTWNVANTTASPVSCQNVDILLSLDGGYTYPVTLATGTANDGSEVINVPYNPTTTARIMVRGTNNIFFDISNQNFTITAPLQTFSISLQPPQQQACPGTPVTYTVLLTPFGGYTGSASLNITGLPAGINAVITPNPASIPGTANIVLTAIPDNNIQGLNSFTVVATNQFETQTTVGSIYVHPAPPSQVALLNPPNGAADVILQPTFEWESAPTASFYHFQLASDPNFTNVLINLPMLNTTTFTPGSPLPEGAALYWHVKPYNTCGGPGFGGTFSFKTLTLVPPDTCVVFPGEALPMDLQPGITNSALIHIDVEGTVTDVNVRNISITHPNVSQIAAGLYSPTGTPVTLFSTLCTGSNEKNLFLYLDDEAAKNYNQIPCPPVDMQNHYKAKGLLNAYDGEEIQGEWELQVIVFPTAGSGTLNDWSLEVCYIPGGAEPLGYELITKDASCHGLADGAAAVTPTGGSGVYTVNWSNGQTGTSISGLSAGGYSVTVSDGISSLSETFLIGQPPAILLNLFATNVQNGNDGSIDLTVSGGVPPYKFEWSNGANTEDLTDLEPGTYCVTVTDDSGCQAEACATVADPSACSPWVPETITPAGSNCFIQWQHIPGAVAYRIRYQPVGNPPNLWIVKQVSGGFNSIVLAGLVPGTDYVFQTSTLCSEEFTPWSNNYYFSTLPDPYNDCKAWEPGTITTTNTTATIQIQPVPGASQYLIRYRVSGGSTWLSAQTLATVFNLNNLMPGTTYEFRTQTKCASGWTSYVSAITYLFTTQGGEMKGVPVSVKDFNLQPNPAQEFLEIKDLPEQATTIILSAPSGQHILQQPILESQPVLQIGHLPQGMYFITITGEGMLPVTKRFVKN